VDRRERKEILGQWGVRELNPREERERRKLEADLEGNPLLGTPLRSRLRNFRPSVDGYVASLGGPLPYMRRLREIEDRVEGHGAQLAVEWRELAEEHEDEPEEFARLWRRRARTADFGVVNDLIARHNRWYPVEARLPMDVRTRDFALVGGRSYRLGLLDSLWVLHRFPPDLARALAEIVGDE
jgi:hypothetical protein